MVSINGELYENGIKAYLYPEKNKFYLEFNEEHIDDIEGTFFRRVDTDFNTGVFKTKNDNILKIVDNCIRKLKDLTH